MFINIIDICLKKLQFIHNVNCDISKNRKKEDIAIFQFLNMVAICHLVIIVSKFIWQSVKRSRSSDGWKIAYCQ